ncbi:hypothetical protein SPAR48_1573 [Streptococcus pneumoniae SPAR48]|nr:hypothetical protein SPAR48_1573 [Streptococcus pneumoniae SPAR48]
MIKLIDRYGIEFVKKGKNRYYSPDLKQEMINPKSFIPLSTRCNLQNP